MDDVTALRDALVQEVRPIVRDWFDTGYEAGRLDPDVLTNRIVPILAALIAAEARAGLVSVEAVRSMVSSWMYEWDMDCPPAAWADIDPRLAALATPPAVAPEVEAHGYDHHMPQWWAGSFGQFDPPQCLVCGKARVPADDPLAPAVEARAALTPERLAKALATVQPPDPEWVASIAGDGIPGVNWLGWANAILAALDADD